jgi:hypothetical protein
MLSAAALPPEPRPHRLEWVAALVGSGLLACLAAFIVARMAPPDVVPRDAPPEVFSAARARVHVEQIARTPHPSGSPAARDVEAYLVRTLEALGLEVGVQSAPACTEAAGLRRCGNVRNVIATLSGRRHDDALLLSAHYDSVANSPGAGDDASAVAALLETARALTHLGPLEHDVIFALLDGEEDMLLGSAAFCRVTSYIPRVRFVANFDARGSRGPVTLVGASPDSGAVIAELARVAPHPVLNSFYSSVARVLPNATDAEVFERCGLPTLSFAFADGFENYHRSTDDPSHLDDRSVQHHGSYALALARGYGRAALPEPSPFGRDVSNLVFFDLGASFVVRYPGFWARLFALLLTLLVVVAGFMQRRAPRSSPSALALSAAAHVAALFVAALVGSLVVQFVTIGWGPWSAHLHASALTASSACFVIALALPLLAFAERRWSTELVLLGAGLVWLGLTWLTALFVPGISHIFTWPGLALVCSWFLHRRPGACFAQYALLVPAVLLFTPVIYTLVVVMGAAGAVGAMVCVALLLGASAAPARLFARHARLASVLLFAAGCLIAIGLRVRVRAEPNPPVSNSVAYVVDPDARRAHWASADAELDDWTRQFVGHEPEMGTLPQFGLGSPMFLKTAPFVALEPPTVELVSDTWSADQRTVVLRVRSARSARTLTVWESMGVQFSELRFDGTEPLPIVRFSRELDHRLFYLLAGLSDDGLWSVMLFNAKPEGSWLALTTTHDGPLEFRSTDRSEGLSMLPSRFAPRSSEWTEGYPGDRTLVSAAPLRIAGLPRPVALASP